MSRRIVMVARGVMYHIRHPRQEEALWLAQSPGVSAAQAAERDLVVRGVGPWIS